MPGAAPVVAPVESAGDDVLPVEPGAIDDVSGQRIGTGRALVAAVGDEATVVVTTVGAHLVRELRSVPLDVGRIKPAQAVEVRSDDALALLLWPDTTQLWDLDQLAGPARILPAAASAGFLGDDRIVLVSERVISVIDSTSGSVVDRTEAAAGRKFGPLAVGRDGGWWAVAVGPADSAPGPARSRCRSPRSSARADRSR